MAGEGLTREQQGQGLGVVVTAALRDYTSLELLIYSVAIVITYNYGIKHPKKGMYTLRKSLFGILLHRLIVEDGNCFSCREDLASRGVGGRCDAKQCQHQ